MKNPIVLLVLLGLLLMAIVAPFSALAMLMLFTFVSVLLMGVWAIIRTALTGNSNS